MPAKSKSGSLTRRYKKQHGLHHKHGDQYLKVYWPYIPVALVIFAGILTSVAILNTKTSNSANSSISSAALLDNTNQLRSKDNLGQLQLSNQLATAAQIKANDMAVNNYWSPVSPTGQTPWQIVKSTGYQYTIVGENLAYGFSSSQSLLNAWSNSSAQRSNILNGSYSQVGFGVALASNFRGEGRQEIVVALYAEPAGGVVPTQATSAFTSASYTKSNSQSVARIETLSGNHSYMSVFVVGLIAGTAMAIILLRHTLVLRKWAREGEALAIKHPVIDLCLVAVVISAAVLNQTVGIIN